MTEIEGTQDEQKAARDDALEDLELSAEIAGEVSGGDGTTPAPPVIHNAWPSKLQ